jgi:hypothetical protein
MTGAFRSYPDESPTPKPGQILVFKESGISGRDRVSGAAMAVCGSEAWRDRRRRAIGGVKRSEGQAGPADRFAGARFWLPTHRGRCISLSPGL